MANETKIRNGLVIEGTLVPAPTNRILVIDSTTGLVGYRDPIDITSLLTNTLARYEVIVGDSGGEATVIDSNSVGDVLVDETNGLTIKAGAIVNADVNASAAIAYSKLALTGGIVNADIATAAAIAYSKLALTGGIVNADIATAAAIARTKTASGTAYRILANNASGVMSENAALVGGFAIISDGNGQLAEAATTNTQIGYLSTSTSDIQSQLDNLVATKPINAIVKAPTAGENGYAITWNDSASEYTLTDPVAQGLPTGGTTRQFLGKNTGADYDASWLNLVLTDIIDVSALVADLNLLAGADAAGITSTEIGYINGVTSSIQTQLNNKLSSSLAANALFVGSGGNIAIPLVAGPEGYVLSISGGTPAWISPTAFNAEAAQDAVGGILDDGTIGEIVFTYDDSGGTISATMENDAVTGKVLTGYSSGAGTVAATDTILEAIQKLNGNIGALTTVATDAIWAAAGDLAVGTGANTAAKLSMGSALQILRVNAGATALEWAAASGGIGGSTGSTDNAILRADGAGGSTAQASSLFIDDSGNLTLGTGSLAGGRIISVSSSDANASLGLSSQGSGSIALTTDGTIWTFAGQTLSSSSSTLIILATSQTAAYYYGGESLNLWTNNQNTGDYDSGNINIVTGNAGSGGTGDHNSGNVYINLGSKQGTGVVGNIGLFTSSVADWQDMEKGLFIGNVTTEPTAAIANGITLYSKDSSDGSANSTLAMYLEQAVEAIGTFIPSHKLKVWINGTEYWISLDAV